MSVVFIQKDGRGGINASEITKDGEDTVIVSPHPPLKSQKVRPFVQYLTNDGTSSGSNNMGIDGSVTNQSFFINSNPKDDRYITALSFIVGYGVSGKPFQWADNGALGNGHRLFYESQFGEVDIHGAIKTNQDLFRLVTQIIPSNWEVRHVNANNDYGYIMSIDLTKMGLSNGVKLDRGSTQKLCMAIRDDATAAVSFNMIAYGFDRFE